MRAEQSLGPDRTQRAQRGHNQQNSLSDSSPSIHVFPAIEPSSSANSRASQNLLCVRACVPAVRGTCQVAEKGCEPVQHGRTWLPPLFLQTSTPQTAAPVPVVYIHTIKATAAPKPRRAYPPDSTTTTPRAPQRDTHLYCIHPLHRRLVMYRGLHVNKNENLGVSAGDVRAPAVRARRGAAAGQDRIRGQKGMQKTWRRWRGCSPSLRALGFGF